jgi:phosphoglycerate-specific signal transduction histidine kinase
MLRRVANNTGHPTAGQTMEGLEWTLITIAHEINQPLGAIVANGCACPRLLAAEQPDLVEARETVEDIFSDGRRASVVLARVRRAGSFYRW